MVHRISGYRFEMSFLTPSKSPRALRTWTRDAALATLKKLPQKVLNQKLLRTSDRHHLHLAFVGKTKIQALNRRYRKKNKPTDVLSFSRMEGHRFPVPSSQIGDVIVCWEVAKKQAAEYGIPVRQEVQKLATHGVLHLFGYDHERSAKEARRMFKLQDQILKKLTRGSLR